MALFPTPVDEVLFYIVFLAWAFAGLFERVVILGSGQGKTKSKSDRGSFFLIYATVFGSISVAFVFAYWKVAILPAWFFFVGIAAMVAGLALREWAVLTLRGYFSFLVRVRTDHRVIDRGPYRFIRHPAYSGSMLTVVGLGLALGSSVGVAVLVVLFSVAYGYRIRVEEKALLRELGDAYGEYMRRTKRLIPFLV